MARHLQIGDRVRVASFHPWMPDRYGTIKQLKYKKATRVGAAAQHGDGTLRHDDDGEPVRERPVERRRGDRRQRLDASLQVGDVEADQAASDRGRRGGPDVGRERGAGGEGQREEQRERRPEGVTDARAEEGMHAHERVRGTADPKRRTAQVKMRMNATRSRTSLIV